LSELEGELGGALSSQGCGECCGVLNLAWEGSSTVNFGREARWDSLALDEENARRRPCWCLRGGGSEPGASTARGDTVGKQLRGGEVRARRCTQQLCPGGRASPPARHCSKLYPLSLWFCEIQPKFELEPKCHQNKTCSEFYKLQNMFWWPKLILNGTWWIWPNSLKFKIQFGEIQIFDLGQIRISKITFDFL